MTGIRFDAPPTVAEFMRSNAFFRIVAGPVGSGKTTGCIFELLRRAINQRPAPDGVRYTRFAIVRQTLEQMRSTVLKDIQQWLGPIQGYKVSDKTITVAFTAEDGTRVHSEWLLIPLEDAADQSRLLSSQLTGAWMSEAIDIAVDLVSAISGRCGRYPSGAQGGVTWKGIIADTNLPSAGSDWHKAMELERPDNWDVFIQPGGMEEDAENLEWLWQTAETLAMPVNDPRRREQGRTYYVNALNGGNVDWQDRYVHARYGADPSGQTVFRNSLKMTHFKSGLVPVRHKTLIVGQDFGRNPYSLICQMDHRDRLLVLEEVAAEGMGLEQHVKANLRPALMQDQYIGLPYYVIGDPAGNQRGQVFDTTPFQHLRNENIQAYAAPTNDVDKRLAAVEGFLLKEYADGHSIYIDQDKCPTLMKALTIKYRYARRRNGQLAPQPEKTNPWSDVVDCLQYVCLAAGSGLGDYVSARMATITNVVKQAPRGRISAGAWT